MWSCSGSAGGGGSFNAGSVQINLAGVNDGHGFLTISFDTSQITDVPEPSTFSIIGSSLALFWFSSRRKRKA